ncbi:MAG: hypothetical protein KDH20_19895 [Rhodocyclaceae bacterium]|nr:hypothetical protein [Rhodocyclaceae bacterium]
MNWRLLPLALCLVTGHAVAAKRCNAEQAQTAYAELVARANARLVAAHQPATLVKEKRGHVRVARSSAADLGPLANPEGQAALGEAVTRLGQNLQRKPASVCGEALRLREAYRLDD